MVMMRFGLAALLVATFSMITAHPSEQNAVGSEAYKRDEDGSAIELDSVQTSSPRKRDSGSLTIPDFSSLDKMDFTSDAQLASTIDDSKNRLPMSFKPDDQQCSSGSVIRNGKRACQGQTKPLLPNPSEEDELEPLHGVKPEPNETPNPLPEEPVTPESSPPVAPSEPRPDLEWSPLLELLNPKYQGSPDDAIRCRPQKPRHLCCQGPLGKIVDLDYEPYTVYLTIQNCQNCKLSTFLTKKKRILSLTSFFFQSRFSFMKNLFKKSD